MKTRALLQIIDGNEGEDAMVDLTTSGTVEDVAQDDLALTLGEAIKSLPSIVRRDEFLARLVHYLIETDPVSGSGTELYLNDLHTAAERIILHWKQHDHYRDGASDVPTVGVGAAGVAGGEPRQEESQK